MKIRPQPNMVQLKIEEARAGALDTSSKETAVELAEVIAIGKAVDGIKVGDKVFVKSWAVDIITHNDKRYFFVDITSNGVLAIVN